MSDIIARLGYTVYIYIYTQLYLQGITTAVTNIYKYDSYSK